MNDRGTPEATSATFRVRRFTRFQHLVAVGIAVSSLPGLFLT